MAIPIRQFLRFRIHKIEELADEKKMELCICDRLERTISLWFTHLSGCTNLF